MSISPTLTRDEVREVDRRAMQEFGLCGLVLMENAGRGCADLLARLGVEGRVCICCGKGNNAGDGFVVARHLEAARIDVEVLLLTDPDELTGDAAVNLEILRSAGTPMRRLDPNGPQLAASLRTADWIVDALLGTGLRGEVREPFAGTIEQINQAGRNVLAVDLPSGLDCDTGQPLGACVRADHTATFVARKRGFDAPEAAEWMGTVHVLLIGVPRLLLAAYNL